MKSRDMVGIGLAVLVLMTFDGSRPTAAEKQPEETTRPTLAVEDTLKLIAEPYPEILVTAPRQTLDEILRHVAEGEAARDSLMQDLAFTLHVRLSGRDNRKAPDVKSELYFESTSRFYQKRPNKLRMVRLKEWSRFDRDSGNADRRRGGKQKKGGVRVQVSFDADMSEQFIAFAFDPKLRDRFKFRIEDRKLLADQVVYVLGFTPRSSLDPLPTGRVWVNTNDFVILREEFSYRDRSPLPYFMEALDSCVIERVRVDKRYWVVSRILGRATLTDEIRWMARIGGEKIPKVADFVMARTDWIINGGVPDSLFVPAGPTSAEPLPAKGTER
jgi:hypothetical protein